MLSRDALPMDIGAKYFDGNTCLLQKAPAENSSHLSIWKSLWNVYNNYNRKRRLLFYVSATFKYIIKCHPPSLPQLFVHFKHTFVTHSTKISCFSITVTSPPRNTACHPPKFWTCTKAFNEDLWKARRIWTGYMVPQKCEKVWKRIALNRLQIDGVYLP